MSIADKVKTKKEFSSKDNSLSLMEIEAILHTLSQATIDNFKVRSVEPLYTAISKLNKQRQKIKSEREAL